MQDIDLIANVIKSHNKHMMRQAILDFPKQFTFEPRIENARNFRSAKKFIICGMGGSHLAGDILQDVKPELGVIIHKDYGLPRVSLKTLKESLIILSSYSGNTEEVISAFEEGFRRRLNLISIAVGGKLIDLAQQHHVPHIQIPNTGIQPRSALGFSFLAILKAIGEKKLLGEAKKLAKILKPATFKRRGKVLAKELKGFVPVIYTSARNFSIAYNWKIKLNETGKIPAFYNVLPELNHNEMTGFDVKPRSRGLAKKFYFLILRDRDDHPQNLKRLTILAKLYKDRGLPVKFLELKGRSRLEKIFSSLLLADWFAFYTARHYGLEAEQVPMVEEFKKLIM